MHTNTTRDYSLDGPTGAQAAARGLVSAQWFSCNVDRKEFKALLKRDDWAGARWIGLWFVLLLASGVAAYASLGTTWVFVAFAVYGVLYSVSDHAAHELSHGTPFKSVPLNTAFYQLASFMTLHEPVYWRWSHARHHTDTLIVGSDREIAFQRPFSVLDLLLDVFFLKSGTTEILRTFKHALGFVGEATKSFVPESEVKRMVRSSRVFALLYLAVPVACVLTGSIVPALFLVLPRFYAGQLALLFNITQHAGMEEDVLDHRKNCRTILLNPVLSFLYMNMNYHLEHHMFPLVPLHALPRLHALIRSQCPTPYDGLLPAYRELIPAVWQQRKDASHSITREVPGTATQGS